MPGPCIAARDRWLGEYRFGLRLAERGHVISVGDGIVWVGGMPRAAIDDVLQFEDGSLAQVFDLGRERVGGVLLQHTEQLTAGTAVHRSRAILSLPVGEGLLGRIIDPLGNPLDGDGRPASPRRRARLDGPSPPITDREFVNRPLCTGCRIIDCLIPIGRGQRQLLIGDEGLGRSALAIDAVISQRGQGVYCVYVLIGQKRSTTVNTIDILRRAGALEYTTVVVGEAGALPGLQHLAPFAGCAVAEYWMRHGRDTLVIYDDLSTHARNYRELSLLLRRPPGREAYPGDIFSLHARLLERATCLNAGAGGGSMTALPIVETSEGEIAAYIPTNLISITDGQVHLDRELFASGFRPAIDIGLSVSRIGGQAQHQAIKAEAGRMKLDFLQFLELEAFTRFGTRLEPGMQASIERGRRLRELLKQDRLQPQPIELQLAWMVAFNDHLFDAIPLEEIATRMAALAGGLAATGLTLDADRSRWAVAVRELLAPERAA